MYRDMDRFGKDPHLVKKSKTQFTYPITVEQGRLIFTCSWSDWFIEEAVSWRGEAWDIIRNTPRHTYQILTKRPERIADHLPKDFENFHNVWLGVTVESQNHVDRLAYLKDLPGITFASFEPLLGPIAWDDNMSALDWCIVGGESGNESGPYRYRPMEMAWALRIVQDAKKHNVPVFVKQLGSHLAKAHGLRDMHGGDINEFPSWMKVREYPKGY
jgi:protein gp37